MGLQPWDGCPVPRVSAASFPAPLPRRRFPSQTPPGSGSSGSSRSCPRSPGGEGAADGSSTALGSISSSRAPGGSAGARQRSHRNKNYRGHPKSFPCLEARRFIPIPFPQLSPLPEPGAELELAPSPVLRGAGAQSGSKTPVSSFSPHPLRCAGIIYTPQAFCKGNFSLLEGYSWNQDPGT